MELAPSGLMTVNVDGGFSKGGGQGSWGYVIRDDEGEVIQAGAGKIRNALEAWQIELMACMRGVKAAQSLGIHTMLLETDAMMTVKALHATEFRLSSMGGLLPELK